MGKMLLTMDFSLYSGVAGKWVLRSLIKRELKKIPNSVLREEDQAFKLEVEGTPEQLALVEKDFEKARVDYAKLGVVVKFEAVV